MRRFLMAAAAMVLVTASAMAAPITYSSFLSAGAQNVAGVNNQAPSNQNNPVGATYHSFYAQAGSPINLFGDRQAGHYDMSFWVFNGIYSDTNQFGNTLPAGPPATFNVFGDDQDPPNIPGPFGDPHVNFVAPTTGFYTIAVTNFLSGAGGPPNPYTLSITGNADTPEPASMAIFGGLAIAGIAGVRRRMKKA